MTNQSSALYQRIYESYSKQNFMQLIGAKLESVELGKVVASVERQNMLTQQQGLLHAGVTTTLADSACGYAALSLMPEGQEVLSVEFKINLMRPCLGNKIIATAEVIKPGRRIMIVEATVTDADTGKEIARMLATMIPTDIE